MGDTYKSTNTPWFDPAADYWFRITADHGEMVSGQMIRHFPTSVRISADTWYKLHNPVDCDKFRGYALTEMYWCKWSCNVLNLLQHIDLHWGWYLTAEIFFIRDYRGDGFMLSWTRRFRFLVDVPVHLDTSIGPFLDPSQDRCILIRITLHRSEFYFTCYPHCRFEHPVDDDM